MTQAGDQSGAKSVARKAGIVILQLIEVKNPPPMEIPSLSVARYFTMLTSTDRELHIRREVAHKAAGKVEALEKGVAKGGGLTEEAIRRVRMEIYGIVS